MGALEGLKILDFTTLLPGPYATLVLADLGAEVLRITNPNGYDLVTNWGEKIPGTEITGAAAWLGRNKKTMYLDLKHQDSIEIVKKLVLEYDIVIEQFRPGVMDRLGLGYQYLNEINERLIYCSVTGYGQTGCMKDKAGHDINYLARSGILSAAGRKKSGPSLYNFQIADVAAGSNNAVIGILAAVYHRQMTGEGQYIDISMSDGVVPFNSMDGVDYLAGGEAPERENGLLNGGGIYDFYETSDGGYMSVGSLEPKFFSALCDAVGLLEWKDGAILKDNSDKVKGKLKDIFLTKTKQEWEEIFSDTDACVESVLSLEEAVADKHLNERGMWPEVELPDTDARKIKQPGCPIKLSKTPVEYKYAGYPEGYHTQEIIKRIS